jgi:hypothetical protein
MEIHAIVREVSRDDTSLYAFNDDGTRRFMGRPLRDYLPLMSSEGCIDLPLEAGPLEALGEEVTTVNRRLCLVNSQVDPDVTLEVVDAHTVRMSLDKWRGRDPDNTFLMIAFLLLASDDTEREAMKRAFGDA